VFRKGRKKSCGPKLAKIESLRDAVCMCGCGREIIVFINASGVKWTWTIMFPIDLILAEEEDYLESVQATDELNMYSFYGSFSSSHDQHGCQPSIKAAHHPMPQSCGRVRGLGRNRQVVSSQEKF
jgi:hypothetical protein